MVTKELDWASCGVPQSAVIKYRKEMEEVVLYERVFKAQPSVVQMPNSLEISEVIQVHDQF